MTDTPAAALAEATAGTRVHMDEPEAAAILAALDVLGYVVVRGYTGRPTYAPAGGIVSEHPQTEAGRALLAALTQPYPIPPHKPSDLILAIEREAVAAYIASPEAVEDFVAAIHGWHNPNAMTPACRPDSRCRHEAAAILAALRGAS